MVAVVFRCGLPAGTARPAAGLSTKQLAAVISHSAPTRAPEQPR